jgi:energy-coupling factor transporter transmembrane protein EcfT
MSSFSYYAALVLILSGCTYVLLASVVGVFFGIHPTICTRLNNILIISVFVATLGIELFVLRQFFLPKKGWRFLIILTSVIVLMFTFLMFVFSYVACDKLGESGNDTYVYSVSR